MLRLSLLLAPGALALLLVRGPSGYSLRHHPGLSEIGSLAPPDVLPIVQLSVSSDTGTWLGQTKHDGAISIIERHDGSHRDLPTRQVSFVSTVFVSNRGSSSLSFLQRSFSIELRRGMGERKASLLGMPAGKDWVLVACWADKTCMRNALAYTIAREQGRWAPRTRFVELLVNQKYHGLYQLAEAPRRGDDRVAIPRPGETGEALTGGYVVRREQSGKANRDATPTRDWASSTTAPGPYPHQQVYTYHYPRHTVITGAQRRYIQGHMAAFEDAMKGPRWDDPDIGYAAWIDVDSWADHFILNEVTNNVDAYYRSMYITKLRDRQGARGKLVVGPPWDFNLAFGNAEFRDGWRTDRLNITSLLSLGGECHETDWLTGGPPLCDRGCCVDPREPGRQCTGGRCWSVPFVPFYWERLSRDPAFQRRVKCRWTQQRRPGGPLDDANVDRWLAGWTRELTAPAVGRHVSAWPTLKGYVWPNPYVADPTSAPRPGEDAATFFRREVEWLRAWVHRRLRFLDAALPGTCPADEGHR